MKTKDRTIKNVKEQTWTRFSKQAKSRGTEQAFYLEELLNHKCSKTN